MKLWREKQQKTAFVYVYENKKTALNVELRYAVFSTPFSDTLSSKMQEKHRFVSVSLCRRWRLLLGWMR